MRRFFFKPEERIGQTVVFSEGQAHHICTVLRLQTGMQVELFDGTGGVHIAELIEIAGQVRARIISSSADRKGIGVPLWVGQGLLKGKHMDTVIQKCTELGVSCLIPLMSSRCQGRLDSARDWKKHERWQRIVEESCKQCGRPRPMELLETKDFHDVIASPGACPAGLKILFWEDERDLRLHDLLPFQDVGCITILLGPEGGFSGEEVAIARDAGWRTVSLGTRILRAETATLASVAIIQHLLGAI
jgi:16S rRNA (uracil1498-N3)-methyltransferase